MSDWFLKFIVSKYKLLTINLPLFRDGPDNEALNSDSKHSRPSMETIIDLSRALSLSLVSPVTCPMNKICNIYVYINLTNFVVSIFHKY